MTYPFLNVLLVVSNFFMLPTLVYLVHRMIKDKKLYLLEFFTFSSIMIVSSIYHICKDVTYISSVYDILYHWDRIFAYQSANMCIIHISDYKDYSLKYLIWVINIIIVTIFQYGIPEYSYVSLFFTIISDLIILCIVKRFWNTHNIYHFFDNNDWLDFFGSLFFVFIGLSLFIYSSNTNDDNTYAICHSFWHMFIFISTWVALDVRDKDKSLFCINRNKNNKKVYNDENTHL